MGRYTKQDDPNSNEKVIPSVTEIISDCTNSSDPLTQWAANMTVKWIKENCIERKSIIQNPPTFKILEDDLNKARFNFRNVSETALSIGTEVHKAIEDNLKGKDPIIDNVKAETAYISFLGWKKDVNLKPILLEETIYGNGWAGTLDFYGYYKNKLYVIDWKTSASHYPEQYGPQVAAYRYGLYKMGYKIQGSGILRIDKETGIPDWQDYSNRYIKDLLVFNAMVKLYMTRYPEIEKKVRN